MGYINFENMSISVSPGTDDLLELQKSTSFVSGNIIAEYIIDGTLPTPEELDKKLPGDYDSASVMKELFAKISDESNPQPQP
ncbi:hypothetical protein LRY64_00110 [Candidatus Woesebacteria bacterium]|nr:hypothetical protein [Candidatus Woesebacteria bacterium]